MAALLAAGGDPAAAVRAQLQRDTGSTPLSSARSPPLQSSSGDTPLHLAAAAGHAPVVDRLLRHELQGGSFDGGGDGPAPTSPRPVSARIGGPAVEVDGGDGHAVPWATRRGLGSTWAGWFRGSGGGDVHMHLGGPIPKGFRVRYSIAAGVLVAVVVVAVLVSLMGVEATAAAVCRFISAPYLTSFILSASHACAQATFLAVQVGLWGTSVRGGYRYLPAVRRVNPTPTLTTTTTTASSLPVW